MTKLYQTIILMLCIHSVSFGQSTQVWPSGPEEINTGVNSTYIVQSVVLDNTEIVFGYNIGAFYLNDEGELTCGGISAWTGGTTQIAAYGDDTTTPEKDGFTDGEQIIFQALNTYNNITYDASVQFLNGSSSFSANGINIISEFTLTPQLLGCTDTSAFNFDETANTDDGSCVDIVYGCTDMNYLDYNSNANTNDGSCTTIIVFGCMDETAFNFNNQANTPDESCIATVLGCIDETAFNFNNQANTNDNSCIEIIFGCLDETAFNYNENANTSNNSCEAVVLGCTDINYTDYSPNANTDDGSCSVLIVEGCMDEEYLEYASLATESNPSLCITLIVEGCMDNTADNFNSLANVNSFCEFYGCTNTNAFNYDSLANVDNNSCIDIIFGCLDAIAFNYNMNANTSDNSCVPIITGCMDTLAFNYNIQANTNDASICVDVIMGCTDSLAYNYNLNANTTDNSCIEVLLGCIDESAFNYNQDANTDDGNCIDIQEGCTNQAAFNYNNEANTEDDTCLLEINLDFTFELTNNTTNFNIPLEIATLILGEDSISSGDLIGGFYIHDGQLYCAGYSEWIGTDLSIPLWQDNPDIDGINGITDGNTIFWIAQQTQTMYNYALSIETQVVGLQTIFVTDISVNENIIIGCMDSTAFNFNSSAMINDNSCIEIIQGCTNQDACNYNAVANTDDNSCILINANIGISNTNTLTVQTNAAEPTFSWSINGIPTGNNSEVLIIFLEGIYEVTITDVNGCQVSSQISIDELTIEDLTLTKLDLYPNPSKSEIKVYCKNRIIESIALFALNGQMLNLKSDLHTNESFIERTNLKAGIYMAKIILNDGKIIFKKVIFE